MQRDSRNSTDLMRDLLIGFSDGLVLPFALVAGLTVAGFPVDTILVGGIILPLLASLIMGISGYLTEKEELKELQNLISRKQSSGNPEKEDQRAKKLLSSIGIPEELTNEAAGDFSKDQEEWSFFHEQLYPNLVMTDPKRPAKAGINIMLAYLAGGCIPLFPFFINEIPIAALKAAALLALSFSVLFGLLKSKINGLPLLAGAIKSLLITAASGGGAMLVASLF